MCTFFGEPTALEYIGDTKSTNNNLFCLIWSRLTFGKEKIID